MSSQTKQTSKSMTKQNKINRTREQSPSPEPVYTSKYEEEKYEKKNYEVPSKKTYLFDRSNQPMAEICEETNYFQQLPDDIKFRMFRFICEQSHEGPSVYGEYDAPPDRKTTDSINGKGGYFLQKTTEVAGIYLIWHNHEKNIYKFWGPTERAVRDAMNRIRGRIVKYVVHMQPPAHADVENPSQNPAKYNVSKHDLAASPPPNPNPSIYFSRVFKEDDHGWSANFVASAEYCQPTLMRSESMAVADAYDDTPENEEECQPRLCRSISMM